MFLEYTVFFLSLTGFLLRLFPLPGMPFLAAQGERSATLQAPVRILHDVF